MLEEGGVWGGREGVVETMGASHEGLGNNMSRGNKEPTALQQYSM